MFTNEFPLIYRHSSVVLCYCALLFLRPKLHFHVVQAHLPLHPLENVPISHIIRTEIKPCGISNLSYGHETLGLATSMVVSYSHAPNKNSKAKVFDVQYVRSEYKQSSALPKLVRPL